MRQGDISRSGTADQLYETDISDARWIAYDIPGNVGWIVYIVCAAMFIRSGLSAFSIAALVPALFMVVGIVELVSERIARLDRVLPRRRLLRGFGMLALGGAAGVAAALACLVADAGGLLPWVMLAGAALCAIFGWLLFKGYKKRR